MAYCQRWGPRGHLLVTSGARNHYRCLMDDLLSCTERFRFQELAYDPCEAELLIQPVREQGTFLCIEIN